MLATVSSGVEARKKSGMKPDDAETSLIWKEACNCCKCLCTHNDQPRRGQRQVLWWSEFCDFCYNPDRQTPGRLQCKSGHRPPNLGRSLGWRSRKVQQQWPPLFGEVCRAWTADYLHNLPSANSQQDVMDAAFLQTLASHWLCHSTKVIMVHRHLQQLHASFQDVRMTKTVWCRLLDRAQACCQQTQPAHSACTATRRQESAKETRCLQAETRQQEASLHQWYLQPITCNGTPFRWSRRELDSLQRHHPFFSNGFHRTSIS